MADLTPAQHAQLGCDYLDELLNVLQSSRWCFHDTFGIERRISEHAEALGIATPLDRPSKPAHETAEELQIWLKMHDPLTDTRHERLISSMIFAPPPAHKGTRLKTVYRPLNEREKGEFRQFVDRLKREMQRRAEHGGAGNGFAAVLETDAKTKAAWERARAKSKAYADAMRAANAGSADDLRAKLEEMADAIREGLRASGDELAAQGFNPPATIEDWEHLARIVEIPLETIRSGNLTAREIHSCALAWADRQKIVAKLSASARAPTSTQPPAPGATAEAEDASDMGGQPPALTQGEQVTLRALASFDPSILASVRQIVEAMDPGEAVSERTVTPALRKLVKLDLAERPEGQRRGTRLTPIGRRLAAKMPKIAD